MRILVCGSRTWTDRQAILTGVLQACSERDQCYCDEDQGAGYTYQDEHGECMFCDAAHYSLRHHALISSTARGADTLGAELATEYRMDLVSFPANWARYGRAAGILRNQQMLDEGKPDLVLAFWDGKSRGTADMINRARKAGVEVRIIQGGN